MRGLAACSLIWLTVGCARIEFASDGGAAADGGGVASSGGAGGAGGAGATDGGAGGAPTAGNGGGGNDPGVEDCTNDSDDDANGLVDCEDPACATSVCVDVPDGWQGPVALALTGPGACVGNYDVIALDGVSDLSFSVASCTCACMPVGSGPCTLATGVMYDDPACGASINTVDATTTCTQIPSPNANVSSLVVSPALAAGSCSPVFTSNTSRVRSTPELACGGAETGGGCAVGACAPPPAAGFVGPCIFAGGDADCPPGFDDRLLIEEDVVDDRACSTCSCGTQTCVTTIETFSNGSCAAGSSTGLGASSTACAPVAFPGVAGVLASFGAPEPCPASGGMATGTVAGTTSTVCCSSAD